MDGHQMDVGTYRDSITQLCISIPWVKPNLKQQFDHRLRTCYDYSFSLSQFTFVSYFILLFF